jgi:hypothetical protein
MGTICFQVIALVQIIGAIKIQVEVVLSGLKDSHMKIGELQMLDQEWKHQQYPMALMTSTVHDH